MKKALPLLGLLLVLAGVIVFTQRRTGSGGGGGKKFSIDRAAELAPADAALFVAIPDVDRTMARWRENEFALGVKSETLGLPAMGIELNFSWLFPLLPDLLLLKDFGKVQPAATFFAVGESPDVPDRIVVGLRYQGKKSDLEEAIRRLKEKLFKIWPGAKSELSKEHGIEVESITGVEQPPPQITPPSGWMPTPSAPPPPPVESSVHIAFRDDWVFLATDRKMLAGTLARYVGAADAGKSLALAQAFAKCRQQALPEADFCLWSRWGIDLLEKDVDAADWPVLKRGLHGDELLAVHYEGRFDGATSGRLYLLLGDCVEAHTRSKSPAPGTPFFYQPVMGNPERQRSNAIIPELSERFGSDLTFVFLDHPDRGLPGRVAALELRGEAEAFRFAAVVAEARQEALSSARGLELGDKATDKLDEMGLRPAPVKAAWPLKSRIKLRIHVEDLGAASESWPELQVTPGGGTPKVPCCHLEVPGFFRNGTIALPGLPLPYKPPLLPRSVEETLGQPLVPATLRMRKDGRNWIVDSDLNVLGLNLVNEMMRHQ